MGLLSNLLRFNHGPQDDAGVTVRPARPEEAEAALRIILAPPGQYADDHAASEFITFARDRGIVFDGLHLAERGGKILSAVLPVVSPGRTMLMLCPHGGAKPVDAATRLIVDPVCRWCADRDVQLAQALIDPHDDALAAAFAAEGFSKMAELHYLHVSATPNAPFPPPARRPHVDDVLPRPPRPVRAHDPRLLPTEPRLPRAERPPRRRRHPRGAQGERQLRPGPVVPPSRGRHAAGRPPPLREPAE